MSSLLLLLAAVAACAELRVGTWNIAKGDRLESVLAEVASSSLKEADVLALQEVLTGAEGGQESKLAAVHGGSVAVAGRDAIISRLPIVSSGSLIVNPGTGRQAAWAVLRYEGQDLKFYSVHLSYKIGKNPFVAGVRASEMRAVLTDAGSFPGPVIVAGDYNTIGWFVCCSEDEPALAELMKAGFSDGTASAPGRTHHFAGRTDWIFARGLESRGAELGRYAGSDHRWMMSEWAAAAGAQRQGRTGKSLVEAR